MTHEQVREQERRRDVCLAILRKKRKDQAALVEEYIAEAEHMSGHRYWSDHFYRDGTIRGNDLLGDFDNFVKIQAEQEREAADMMAFTDLAHPVLRAEPPAVVTVETTVFAGPRHAVPTHSCTLTGQDVEYLHEELLRHLSWAEQMLGTDNCVVELSLVPMADDYIIIESFGGIASSVAGVIKVYTIDTDICPGGDGYGN